MINNIRHYFEKHGFLVLSRMGMRLGIPVTKLRIFFIYSTFATAGVFFLVYLFLAFFYWLKDAIITKRPNVFDL